MSKRLTTLAAIALLALSPAMASDTAATTSVELLDTSGFSGKLGRYGNLYLAGQPDEAGLNRMAEAGVVTVINLRTPGEMENLGFDQPALVRKLGMTYVHVPLGGDDYPKTPEALDKVSEAIARADGAPVLLHCASAGRVSQMFAAWLHREKGLEMGEAARMAREVGSRPIDASGFLAR